MLALLLRLGVPNWLVKPLAYLVGPLLIGGLLYLAVTAYGGSRYRAGVADERAATAARLARDRAAQLDRERTATARLEQSRRQDAAAASQRKSEIDDATRNLPDQAPTARQRSRACLSLRAEAKAAGGPQPAC